MTQNYNEQDVQQWVNTTVQPQDDEDSNIIPLHQPGYDEYPIWKEWEENLENEIINNNRVEVPETPPPQEEPIQIPLIHTKRGVILCNGERIETAATIPITEDDRGSDKTVKLPGPSFSSLTSATEEIREVTNNKIQTANPKTKQKTTAKSPAATQIIRDPKAKVFLAAVRDLQRLERDWRQRWQWDELDNRTKIFRTKRDREENLILEQRQTNRRVAEHTADIARMHKRRMLKLGNSADKAIVIA